MKSARVQLLILTILAYYAFFLFGFADNIKGPIIPALLVDLKLSYAGGSSLLLSAYVGFMAGVLASGLIASRRNNRVALVIAGISLALGAAGNALGASVLLLSATFFLLGFGLGCIEVGANGLIASLYPAESGRYLNLLAVFHGAGSMIAPLVAGMLIAGGTSWRGIYAIVIPLAALQALLLILFKRSGSPRPAAAVQKLDLSILLNRDLLLYSLFLIFYVAAEIGVASWMVDFLMKAKGFSVGAGSVMLSVYFGAVMAGRFIGSFLVERIGYRRILIWMTLASILSLSAGILLSSSFVLLVPLTGLFFSIMFPTATADAAGRTPWSQAAVFSILFFFAGLGGMLGPWLVGIGAEFTGIQGGFLLNLIFCLLMLVALLLLKPQGGRS
jgi:fucose permease